jgi:deazaflavin-dependent oxidoreductase (nitroreductase family)
MTTIVKAASRQTFEYRPKARERAASRLKGIATGVWCLEMGQGFRESNVYFVRSGSAWVLIDTSWANRARSIKEAAESLFGAGTRPEAILLTHIHADHSGSAPELARTWGCPVYAHPDELPLAAPGDLSTVERYANPLDRWVILPLLRLMPRRRVESMLSDARLEDVMRALDPDGAVPGLPEWECIATPGHTPGHVSFFRERDRVLIAGDALSTVDLNSPRGFVLREPKLSGPPYITTWNWRAAKDSVAVLAKLGPSVIAGGHGIPMAGPDTAHALRAFAERTAIVPKRQPVRVSPRDRRRPHTACIEGEIIIKRPVEEVFDVVADERNEVRYNPRLLWVEKVTSGPIGRGTCFRAATKTMARPVEMTIEFTQYERPRRLASATHLPTMEIRGALTFEPVAEGTRMRWSWELQLRGVLRLLTPLIARIGRHQEESIWAGLKRFLEAQEARPGPARKRTTGGVRPLPLKERIKTRIEHEVDTRSVRLAAALIRLTKGRIARLWRRQVLLLTTRGRKSGQARTVPLQFFPDGDKMVVVAANSGMPAPPGWYFNLTADPLARVEVGDRTLRVCAEELSEDEAAAFWPRVLQAAPDYARYPRRTSRHIPMVRLVPVG